MTVGSLFSGIGGIDLGLERAGFTVRWQVEVDPYCRTVLERHWPHVYRRSDVRLCDASTLEPVDCIAGGFPCQDISCAGKGVGITGHRSGLWSHFARIVRELKPRFVLVENVPALRTRGADVVLGDLEAAGYACCPVVVGARHVGGADVARDGGVYRPPARPRAALAGLRDRRRRRHGRLGAARDAACVPHRHKPVGASGGGGSVSDAAGRLLAPLTQRRIVWTNR